MNQENVQAAGGRNNFFFRVTPVSKYAAMLLFVLLPFLGGYVGYTYAPEKVVEVEKVVVREDLSADTTAQAMIPTTQALELVAFPELVGGMSMRLPQDWQTAVVSESSLPGTLLTSPDFKIGVRGVDSYVEQGMRITISQKQATQRPDIYLDAIEQVENLTKDTCTNCQPSKRIVVGGEQANRSWAHNVEKGLMQDGVFIGGLTTVSMVRQGREMMIHIEYAETPENEVLIEQVLNSITFES